MVDPGLVAEPSVGMILDDGLFVGFRPDVSEPTVSDCQLGFA